nr:uncharacterized protein LOC113689096 [Coffea arabica]
MFFLYGRQIERLEAALTYGLEGQYSSCLWLYKIKAAATCPQQRNAWDCGLLMLKYMDMLSSGIGSWKWNQYNSEQERRKVALSLVLDDANVVRHEIMRKANTHRRLEMNKVEVR